VSALENAAAVGAPLRRRPSKGTALAELVPDIRRMRPRVVIGVPGDDVHVVANQLAETLLSAVGYDVTNLGVLVPCETFVDAARADDAAAVLLSSVNGHALLNCGQLPRALQDAGLRIPVYLGGNLSVGDEPWEVVEGRFAALGFARVFSPTVDLVEGVRELSVALLASAEARGLRRGSERKERLAAGS